MSWFSGVVLPGYTMPWLIMNTLIDCDRGAGKRLERLSHNCRNSGFQYRANTYWSSECIVGKVLGAARESIKLLVGLTVYLHAGVRQNSVCSDSPKGLSSATTPYQGRR
jgi:hypothetical protein